MSDHERCHRTSLGRHFRFVFHHPNGDHISTGWYDNRIHDNTDISWLWRIVSAQIDHPIDYVQLVVGEQIYNYINRIALRDGSLLQDLRLDCVQRQFLGIDSDLLITMNLLPPPKHLGSSQLIRCICDFPGHECCILGRAVCENTEAHHRGCTFCGNNEVCRSFQCDHSSCREHLGPQREPGGSTERAVGAGVAAASLWSYFTSPQGNL